MGTADNLGEPIIFDGQKNVINVARGMSGENVTGGLLTEYFMPGNGRNKMRSLMTAYLVSKRYGLNSDYFDALTQSEEKQVFIVEDMLAIYASSLEFCQHIEACRAKNQAKNQASRPETEVTETAPDTGTAPVNADMGVKPVKKGSPWWKGILKNS
jgi:hypothetical protein